MNLEQRVQHLEETLASIVKSDRYIIGRTLQLEDGRNIQVGRSNGTKIGLSALEKVGFFGTTPATQHSSTGQLSTTGGFGGTPLADNGTWIAGIGSTAYTIGDAIKALKEYGLLAP